MSKNKNIIYQNGWDVVKVIKKERIALSYMNYIKDHLKSMIKFHYKIKKIKTEN